MYPIDGKLLAQEMKNEITATVSSLTDKGKNPPHLALVIVGDDGASLTYVESIKKNTKEVGILCSAYQFPASISEKELLEAIDFINQDDEVDGCIIQLPLPKHIDTKKIIQKINPKKDVDCFHPENMGKLVLGEDTFLPATPHAVMELLKRYEIETIGKNCVVVGRSNIVGKPLALLLLQNSPYADATVTICHSKTQNLQEVCAQADILLVAIGKPEFITAEYVQKDAVVIDVGIHRVEDKTTEKGYRICGDVKFNEVSKKCKAITPVPGGVGSVTMACLLKNTLKAYQQN
ncbi:MAG: bifunctional methylenetetrahydrofolate dehydrogenase/methenyltetrahydrofolate cyclohydrolase FolD [Bacteroidetes bacterium]|nr:bifunctional methylenetetrahydrofolate dehydrogenase/methenyltetrahydrofolate cyclohydrolase FolD [Bacteroidota bacterium]MCL2302064.1 bifunctional methylenetetrahydrofolate dehydrogenase/methenyltetrahydrofolate cyclohydrolase FolD [Lentimicrobiaceae bacterium]